MSIFRVQKDKENPYVQLHKKLVYDNSLSFKAKGILVYLLSRPDDWKVYENEIVKHSKDGKDSVSNGIKELIKAGYISRSERRTDGGKFGGYEYDVFEQPSPERIIRDGKTEAEKPFTEKPPLVINDSTKNDLTNAFEQFWIIYPRKIDKKKAYKSFKTAIKDHPLQKILEGTKKYAQQVQKEGKNYIKYPATFLNNESFIDGYEEQQEKPRPQQEQEHALAGMWGVDEYE